MASRRAIRDCFAGRQTCPAWTAHPPMLGSIVQESAGGCEVVHIWNKKFDGAALSAGSQEPHFARDGVAHALGLPLDKVRGIWVRRGSYGRNDAGDAGLDAALL